MSCPRREEHLTRGEKQRIKRRSKHRQTRGLTIKQRIYVEFRSTEAAAIAWWQGEDDREEKQENWGQTHHFVLAGLLGDRICECPGEAWEVLSLLSSVLGPTLMDLMERPGLEVAGSRQTQASQTPFSHLNLGMTTGDTLDKSLVTTPPGKKAWHEQLLGVGCKTELGNDAHLEPATQQLGHRSCENPCFYYAAGKGKVLE